MPGVAILQGPNLPADCPLGFCAVCAGMGKFEALALIKNAVTAHESGGQGVKTWPLNIPPAFLNRAVTWAPVQALGMAAPVCWGHAIALQNTGSIIPVQGMPPGLNGGQGVPLLGQ